MSDDLFRHGHMSGAVGDARWELRDIVRCILGYHIKHDNALSIIVSHCNAHGG